MASVRVIRNEVQRCQVMAASNRDLQVAANVIEAFAKKTLNSNPNAKETFAQGVEKGVRYLQRRGEIPKVFHAQLNYLIWLSRI
jgi:hypothetical protein